MTEKKSAAKQKRDDIPGWSWIIAALGLALVLGSAGFMLYQAFAGDSSPPLLAIETESIRPNGTDFLVRIVVTNRGGSSAAGVSIEGTLRKGGESVERSAITIDYVPSGSERRAGLVFSRDPGEFELQVRATGFGEP